MLISMLMYRIIMFSALIILMIALTIQNVQSKVIIVNTNGGNESTTCCANGECPCSSLSTALQNVTNNTIINITSEEIKLEGDIEIGSGNLTNITITSQMAMIICSSNKDTISCPSCDDITVNGITWCNCSLTLGNSSVVNCTLQDITIIVSGSIRFEQSLGSLQINNTYYSGYVNLTIAGSTFYSLTASDSSYSAQWNITISNSTFMAESVASAVNFDIGADVWYSIYMVNITVVHFFNGIQFYLSANKQNISMSLLSSVCIGNIGNALRYNIYSKNSYVSIFISDTEFTDVVLPGDSFGSILYLPIITDFTSTITLKNVNFINNSLNVSTGIIYITATSCVIVNMTNVNFIANKYRKEQPFEKDAAVYIQTVGYHNKLIFIHCRFINNTFSQRAKFFHIYGSNEGYHNNLIIDNCSLCNNTIYDEDMFYIRGQSLFNVTVVNTVFNYNTVSNHIINAETNAISVYITASNFIGNKVKGSCIYLTKHSILVVESSQFIYNIGSCVSGSQATVILQSSNFTANIGSCIYLSQGDIDFNKNILFYNNTADKGATLYIDKGTKVLISSVSTVQFIKNSASLGGAIFVDLSVDCLQNGIVFSTTAGGIGEIAFKDNVARARYSGDALYYSVSKNCKVNANTSDPTSMMYVPYHFNYSQPNSTECCDINCSHLNTNFPAITSPHYVILCGENVEQLGNVTYFIRNIVLGKPTIFKSANMDYFRKASQFVQYNLNCITCPDDIRLSSNGYTIVDNTSPLSLTFSGSKINFNVNVTVMFTSLLDTYIQPIKAEVIVELVPCFNHIGYAYSKENNGCTCAHVSVVKCSDQYNEIEDGYWIGNILSHPTTSLCPTRYCSFIHRNKFTLGYSELPDTVDAQCNDHRTGTACGECSTDYTLTYDTTDCISENNCSTIVTVVVIVSTCLYWLIIAVGVFTLLYYNRRIPLGYSYGIIYYYSMVGILFKNNLYVSESAFLFISVISSFTQLSPQFLGKLCLVKGLSGIDQLFIHYAHPVAVSLLIVVFVIAAKFSSKLSAFISRCRIIRIICLLLLLSYTSFTSTSLQLLRPLTFTDIAEVYTYTSPSIQYFHGRHTFYGTVAIVCELIVGIGLPLLLLLEPFVNKKINFVKIKPLLDEFQDCYRDKRHYRWFACYYLICRQVILLIVFIGSSNYNGMLFFLLITSIIIATIHMWVQPYKSASLNIFDGLILQIMVVSVTINSFIFLQPAATELVLIVVIFPLFIICTVGIREIIKRKLRRGEYTALSGDDARFVGQLASYAKLQI